MASPTSPAMDSRLLERLDRWAGDGHPHALLHREAAARIRELEAGLSASVGYLLNAKIDLETGATKATAIRTIEGGIARARALLGERGE